MAVIKFPTDSEVREAFDKYVSALGCVVHASNYFQETLGALFATLTDRPRDEAFQDWYRIKSDRDQRKLLRGSIGTAVRFHQVTKPEVERDLLWLLDRADEVAEQRNDAVHAPCSLYVDGDGQRMGASFFTGNPRSMRLRGKVILDEFAHYESTFETLTRYAQKIETWLCAKDEDWPDRPPLPVLAAEKERRASPS